MKIVQVGLGGWGKNHFKILQEMGNLVGVCDIDSDRLSKVVGESGIDAYRHLEEMIHSVKPDIGVVTTPTSTHFDIAKLLLDNGVNVFLEKPFTKTLEEGRLLIELAHKNNRKITCGYIERFNPVTQAIAEIKERPILLEFHRESQIPTHIKDVGIVLDTAVHDIETACFLFGDYPVEMSGVIGDYQKTGVEDMAVITLKFPMGVANIVSNWNTKIKMRTIHATYPNMVVRGDFVDKTLSMIKPDVVINKRFDNSNPLRDELQAFIDAVEYDTTPKVTGSHAHAITQIALQILGRK